MNERIGYPEFILNPAELDEIYAEVGCSNLHNINILWLFY